MATKIVDVAGGKCQSYQGNYNTFLKLKEARLASWEASYANQQRKVKEEREWINANKNKPAMASARQQREAKLDKLLKGQVVVRQK